jgi:hypothetical protein
MKIGLSGCSTHEFQLEMRKVKFLLDYQGAREVEYRLARERRSAAGMNIREAVIPSAPVCTAPLHITMVNANLCVPVSYT